MSWEWEGTDEELEEMLDDAITEACIEDDRKQAAVDKLVSEGMSETNAWKYIEEHTWLWDDEF